MTRINFFFAIAVAVFLGLGTLSYSQEKSSEKKEPSMSMSKEQKTVYSCPMHPEVIADKPDKCPKCGMNLVLREEKKGAADGQQTSENSSAKEKIRQAQSLLAESKRELAQDGKYNCCIKDPCDRCALDHQNCDCAEDVKAGKAVCPDCYAGWQRGDGIVKGVKASKVKGSFHSHKH